MTPALSSVCEACGASLIRAIGGFLTCSECEFTPVIVFRPLPTSEPGSRVVKLPRPVMAQQTMTGTGNASIEKGQDRRG